MRKDSLDEKVSKAKALKVLRTASGESLKCLPVLIRNVTVGGTPLESLYAYLFVSDVDSFVLGLDFIRSCDSCIKYTDLPIIVGFNKDLYLNNFSNICSITDVTEINSLILDDEVLSWCRENAPAALKDLPDAELWELMKSVYVSAHQ